MDLTAQDLYKKLNLDGIVEIPAFVSSEDLIKAQNIAKEAIESSGTEYRAFSNDEGPEGHFLNELLQKFGLQKTCHSICEFADGVDYSNAETLLVWRNFRGRASQGHVLKFHYDSYIISALIPILIPEEGKRGDFLIIPNTRKVRKSYVVNLLDKLMLDNILTQWFLKLLYFGRSSFIKKIQLNPGSLYIFWGYRSIHTNDNVDGDKMRSTAIFHCLNPHAENSLKSQLQRYRDGNY